MKYSAHNIYGAFPGKESGFIVNLLSGQADLLEHEDLAFLKEGKAPVDAQTWEGKGYWVDEAVEKARFGEAYLDFLDAREKDEVQIFFVPWYSCNFSCSYCFQQSYGSEHATPGLEVLDAFFAMVKTRFAGRSKYLTLFGGEPLLPGNSYKALIEDFLSRAAQEGLETAIVTTGYTLASYVPLLSRYALREVQVTLDGMREYHDRRRMLKGGQASFDAIVEGVDACLRAGIPVNLRMVVDRENLESLPALAAFAVQRGWTRALGFKTQIGRNYELHGCQQQRAKLYSRAELYADLYKLTLEHPAILEFHKPAFSIASFLWEQGELPRPLFDSCTGTKTEWAFDCTGKAYACTATVGKEGEELGTFWPELHLDETCIGEWGRRDVLSIPECAVCSLRLACGGGCAAVAKNSQGRLLAPDCRPVDTLLPLGMDLYFNEEHGEVQACLTKKAYSI